MIGSFTLIELLKNKKDWLKRNEKKILLNDIFTLYTKQSDYVFVKKKKRKTNDKSNGKG